MSAIDRLKQIQANFKATWGGIQCDKTGRPGTANITNTTRKPIPNTKE